MDTHSCPRIVKTIRDILNETDPSKINHADSGEEMQYQLMRNWLSKYEFGADFIPRLQTSMMDGPASDPATVVSPEETQFQPYLTAF